MIVVAYVSDGRKRALRALLRIIMKMGDFLEAASGIGPERHQLVHAPAGRLDPLCAICPAMGDETEARMVRSFSRPVLAVGRNEQQSVGGARGLFRLVLKENSRMLEICCGDGFNTRHFYSTRSDRSSRSTSTRTRSRTPCDTIPRQISPSSSRTSAPVFRRGRSTTSCGMRRSSILPRKRSYHHGRDC